MMFLLFCLVALVQPAQAQSRYDLVFTHARIVDGTGNPWYYGDVGIQGNRIARIAPRGTLAEAGDSVVHALGLVLSPGFIDLQSHSRFAHLQGDTRVVSKISQGVTTEILGEGISNGPQNARTVTTPEEPMPFAGSRGFDAWLRAMESRGITPNIGSFLGGNTLRRYVRGMAMGELTPTEIDTMRAVVVRAMHDGAFGLATALIYPPGTYSTTEELIEASRAMAPLGGVYITHVRSEGDGLLEGFREALTIGREAGVPVEIYHVKAAGARNWHKGPASLALIDSARAAGVDVQASMYPYPAAGTGLTACIPPWAEADGRLRQNLADPEMRSRIREAMLDEMGNWENFCLLAGPEGVLVLGLFREDLVPFRGQRLNEIADALGLHWTDAAMHLIAQEETGVFTMYFLMSEENVAAQVSRPWMKIATDASGVDPDTTPFLVHPRAYGTFPRVLGRYVREQGLLSLENAIRNMTGAVATRLSIQERGYVREGYFADLVLFNSDTIRDRSEYLDPHHVSEGIAGVWINGVPVFLNGQPTGAQPGQIIRGPAYRP